METVMLNPNKLYSLKLYPQVWCIDVNLANSRLVEIAPEFTFVTRIIYWYKNAGISSFMIPGDTAYRIELYVNPLFDLDKAAQQLDAAFNEESQRIAREG